MMEKESLEKTPLPFLHEIEKLEHLPRTGWLRTIKNPESVAAHSHRVAILALLAPDDLKLDRSECMRMALFHDLAESVIGDIPTFAKVPKDQKYDLEHNGFQYIESLLRPCNSQVAKEIRELWEEYEEGTTPEAKWVREMDKFECLVQAHEYEQRTYGTKDLSEFQGQANKIHTAEAREWVVQLQQERDAHLSKRNQRLPIIFVTGVFSERDTGGLDAAFASVSDHVSKVLELPCVSVKRLLHEKAADQYCSHSQFIRNCLGRGLDVPVSLVVGLLETELKQRIGNEHAAKWMLVSGFPKDRQHLEEFERKVQHENYAVFLQYANDDSQDQKQINPETAWRSSTDDFKNYLKRSTPYFKDFTGSEQELCRMSEGFMCEISKDSETE